MSKSGLLKLAAGAAAITLGTAISAYNSSESGMIVLEDTSYTRAVTSDIPVVTAEIEPVSSDFDGEITAAAPETTPVLTSVTTTLAATNSVTTVSAAVTERAEIPVMTTAVTETAAPTQEFIEEPQEITVTVYIAASGKGTKYHSRPDCSGMKDVIELSREDAEIKGYTPCKKCW